MKGASQKDVIRSVPRLRLPPVSPCRLGDGMKGVPNIPVPLLAVPGRTVEIMLADALQGGDAAFLHSAGAAIDLARAAGS